MQDNGHTIEKRTERAVWVDAARCLAMLPILWLHAGDAPDILGQPVGGSLCLFFVLAGYFMPQQAGACAVRAARLAVAWLLWSLISWGLFCVGEPNGEWTWQQVFGWGTASLNTPLWFLRNLFVYQLIFAALISLGLLPRLSSLWLLLLIGCSYAAEPGQHESLRFDWMSALALGFCLRRFDLSTLLTWLSRHALPLLLLIVVWQLQWHFYPDYLRHEGWNVNRCSLPMPQLAWCILYLLLAIGIQRYLPRMASPLATAGGSMIFCYAAHSLLYAPLYAYNIHWAGNFWAPLIVLPLLTQVYRLFNRRFPRTIRLLCAKRP